MTRIEEERIVYRHAKRGTDYELIGIGKMQVEVWHHLLPGDGEITMADLPSVDMREVAVYRSVTDPNEIWVRPREDFEDGRFIRIATPPELKELRAQGGVTVRSLEWTAIMAKRSDGDPRLEETGDFEAETPFGKYTIDMGFGSDEYTWSLYFEGMSVDGVIGADDPEKLKLAAFADYRTRIFSALEIEAVEQPVAGWQPIETAPKDQPIIGWCVHEADAYHDEQTGKLTDYGCWAEALGRVPNGPAILEWGGEDSDYDEWSGKTISWPNWWFRVGSEFEEIANPTHWMPLPTPPSHSEESE